MVDNTKQLEAELKKLEKIEALHKMVSDSLTKEDFVTSFENVVNYVKRIEKKTDADFTALKANLESLARKIQSDTTGDVETLKKDALGIVEIAVTNMMNDYADRVAVLDDKLAKVRDGEDGKDADEEVIVDKVLSRIPKPLAPYDDTEVREDIEELQVDVEELKKAHAEGKNISVVQSPSRGIFVYIDGVKKGIISNMNLVPGTNMAIAYSEVNGQPTLTFNATGGGPGGISVETPTGLVNASNTTYTVSAEPLWVVADGTTYYDGAGYTYAALSITMDIPPSASIRAIY